MLEFIYNHSPIPFQNIMVSVKGKLFEKQRYTEHYYNELEILKECKNLLNYKKIGYKNFINI